MSAVEYENTSRSISFTFVFDAVLTGAIEGNPRTGNWKATES
jgi:hypothetical protein